MDHLRHLSPARGNDVGTRMNAPHSSPPTHAPSKPTRIGSDLLSGRAAMMVRCRQGEVGLLSSTPAHAPLRHMQRAMWSLGH